MTNTTESAVAPGEIQASADCAEFQAMFGFDRPHNFGPVRKMANGGVKFAAHHERLPCWTFTISPRHETPSGYSIEVWSINENLLGVDAGEQIYGTPTLQRIDLGVAHPTVAASIAAAKTYIWFLMQDHERDLWTAWQRFHVSPAEDDISGWN